jgi:hypothetical protein
MQSMWEIWVAAGAAALYLAQIAVFMRLGVGRGGGWSSLFRTVVAVLSMFIAVLLASPLGPFAAVLTGLTLNVFFGGRMLMSSRRDIRVRRLLGELKGPNPARALGGLEEEVDGLRGLRGGEKDDYDHRAQLVLGIAASVARAGHPEHALAWTTRIEPALLGRPVAAIHAQHEVAFRLGVADREGARRALAQAPRPAIAPWEDALQAMEALLDALEGDAQSAVDRATVALERAPEGAARATWQMARAHGLAKGGALEDAKGVLRAMRGEGGDDLLRRVVAHAGPASRLAEGMLVERGAYR